MSEYDTKPTIDTVLERMEAGFAAMNSRFDAIETWLGEITKDIADIGRKQDRLDERVDIFIEEVLDMKRKIRKSA